LRENRRRLVDMVGRTPGLSLVTPDAGVVAFPRFGHRVSSDDFAHGLIERRGIFVLPGSAFETEGHVRINLGMEPASFSRAMDEFSDYCRTLS
ncbi:MAG: aminotransferase class I/II-fold pyridoxal phosphate-dependent enzyme, partial [Candidatus Latescibacteria bacterium]|nr:aminotransferase class I/II-fold pyridoxal phosphate-dependent enzyme [Candidatus Latescibacterota bacterium]